MSSRNAISGDVYRDQQLMLGLTAQAGKLGLQTPEFDLSQSRSQLLQSRANFRKIIDALQQRAHDLIGQNKDADDVVAAVETAASVVSKISQHLDTLDALAGQPRGSGGGDTVTVNGQPTRILRNADDFRAHYEQRADAAGQRGQIGFADFVRGVAGLRTTPDVQAALSVGTDTAGGFSVPSVVMPQILEALAPASSVLTAGAGILPLDDGAKTFTQAVVDSIPAATWRSEGGAVSESDPAFRGVVMTPRSLAFRFKVSRELLMDGVGIEQALIAVIAQAFAKELDRVALRGSGSAPEPRGILNTTSVAEITNGTDGATLTSQRWTKLLEAVSTILGYDAPMPTAAIMAPRSLVGYAALADTTNQPLARPQLLQDVRFLATSQVPVNLTVGTSTDCTEIYVGDFSKVLFAMRETLSVQKLNELYAATGEIGFVAHARADIAVFYPRAFAVIKGVRAG